MNSFIIASALFAVPLLRDYLAFQPTTRIRKFLRDIQIKLIGLVIIIILLYSTNIFIDASSANSICIALNPEWIVSSKISISVKIIWIFHIMIAICTGLDWFEYKG